MGAVACGPVELDAVSTSTAGADFFFDSGRQGGAAGSVATGSAGFGSGFFFGVCCKSTAAGSVGTGFGSGSFFAVCRKSGAAGSIAAMDCSKKPTLLTFLSFFIGVHLRLYSFEPNQLLLGQVVNIVCLQGVLAHQLRAAAECSSHTAQLLTAFINTPTCAAAACSGHTAH